MLVCAEYPSHIQKETERVPVHTRHQQLEHFCLQQLLVRALKHTRDSSCPALLLLLRLLLLEAQSLLLSLAFCHLIYCRRLPGLKEDDRRRPAADMEQPQSARSFWRERDYCVATLSLSLSRTCFPARVVIHTSCSKPVTEGARFLTSCLLACRCCAQCGCEYAVGCYGLCVFFERTRI